MLRDLSHHAREECVPEEGVIRNMTRTEPGEENDLCKGPVER